MKPRYISDKQNAFSLNGIEIDLDELEEFEKRVKAKREAKLKQQEKLTSTTTNLVSIANTNSENANDSNINETDHNVMAANAEVDELDEYLKTLKLKEHQVENQKVSLTTQSTISNDSIDTRSTANFALLLYWFLAILNLASATFSNRKHYSK